MQDKNIVVDFYSSERAKTEMKKMTACKLKIWEEDVVERYFPGHSRILVVGCGMGRESLALFDKGFEVTGVDISKDIIEDAKIVADKTKRKIKYMKTNGIDLPFEDESYDGVVVWNQTIGIVYGEQKIPFLKECCRVLKKGGVLSFSGHDREYLEKNYVEYLDGHNFYPYANTEIYWETFSIDDIESLAKMGHLKLLECKRGNIYKKEDGTVIYCIGVK